MSEYQYYEWLAVDRPLSEEEMEQVGGLSSHMDVVTATQAVVTYQWGDFKHKPREVLLKYFDAHLYAANWGSRRVMFRFPSAAVDAGEMQAYCVAHRITLSESGKSQVLEIDLSEEEGGDWVEVEGLLSRLMPVREQIMHGDYRALYLAWLRAMELEGELDEAEDGADGDDAGSGYASAPPVPAGLRKLNGALKALMDLFEIDPHLAKAAAESSAAIEPVADRALAAAVARLTRKECDAFLLRVLQGESRVDLDLRKRLIELAGLKKAAKPERSRALSDLKGAARRYADEEERRRKAEAERRRIQELKELATREEQTWARIEQLITRKSAGPYDEAVAYLVKLRELAVYEDRLPAFRERFAALAARCAGKPSLIARFVRVGLMA